MEGLQLTGNTAHAAPQGKGWTFSLWFCRLSRVVQVAFHHSEREPMRAWQTFLEVSWEICYFERL